MIKSHYGFSFIISAVLYTGLGFSLLTLMKQPKVLKKEPEKIIKITVIKPIPKVVAPVIVTAPIPPVVIPPKKIEKPKPKKIVKKKVIKKPKPKPKPKPKKVVKKKVVNKPKPKKVVKKIAPQPQPIVEEVYEEVAYIPTPTPAPAPVKIATQRAVQTPIASPKVDLEAKKRIFLNKVRSNIYTHKKYPKMAKRRNIQGTVHAIFDIGTNGTVSNIQLSGASTILEKAVRKSILKSFPITIPSELKSKFPMYSVSISMDFILN